MGLRLHKHRNESGFVSVEILVAVGFSFIFLTFLCNLMFIGYGKHVLRAAADEGARAGSRIAIATPANGASDTSTQDASVSIAACKSRAESLIESLGKMATKPVIDCAVNVDAARVDATVSASFEPWVPLIPTMDEKATASAVKEAAPK